MAENVEQIETKDSEAAPAEKRQRSAIAFTYDDFDSAAAVAQAIHSNVGHGTCSMAQLAPWMKQSVKSSGFRVQLAAARLFGLIDSNDPETYRLTPLGIRVVDPAQMRAAKAEAFLNVPLFKALFEKYKGSLTPPNAALEREIVALGVSEKQKARARQVFESSAKQTGFREHGPAQLVMPAVVVPPPSGQALPPGGSGGGGGGGSGGGGGDLGLDLDPLLIALLQKIPNQGAPWPKEKRLRWFKTFAMNVSQVYDEEDDPVELNVTAS
ncbi:hypothetical protein [Methylibium sp.]|uniref:hypothetical protein n=1 Tax=Methylibium sp. TaxID=2067992 RepID=UPI003BADA17F